MPRKSFTVGFPLLHWKAKVPPGGFFFGAGDFGGAGGRGPTVKEPWNKSPDAIPHIQCFTSSAKPIIK